MDELRIGIALGSGAAKGWAHIGVLRGLQKLGIAPTMVAGCSIGAFVGAAYAAGKLDELEQWVLGFSSWDVVGLMDLSWRRGGIIGGEKVFAEASKAIGMDQVADLALPFIAVATDLYSGQEIWLEQGPLEDVVGASCAIPGLILPKQVGERWLVDGAVVNPVPVSACRALGAEMVIAVDLQGEVRQHSEVSVRLDLTQPSSLATAEAIPAEVNGSPNMASSEDEPALVVQPLQADETQSRIKRDAPAAAAKALLAQVDDAATAEQPDKQEKQEKGVNNSFVDLLMSGKQWVEKLTDNFSGDSNSDSEPTPNALAVMHQSMQILEQRHKRARLVGDVPEVLILPQVGEIMTMEFQRAEEAIAAGEAAVGRIAHILQAEIERLQRARHRQQLRHHRQHGHRS